MKTLPWVKDVKGQLEKGENGTPHIQGYLHTTQVRVSQIKHELPRAHIEIAKNLVALRQYAVKKDTRVADIPTTRVASQKDVQNTIIEILLEQSSTFEHPQYLHWCLTSGTIFTPSHRLEILSRAESLMDEAVRRLILSGCYGIEFVMSNPQVRNSFKRFLPEIILRQIAENKRLSVSINAASIQDQPNPGDESDGAPPCAERSSQGNESLQGEDDCEEGSINSEASD